MDAGNAVFSTKEQDVARRQHRGVNRNERQIERLRPLAVFGRCLSANGGHRREYEYLYGKQAN